MYSVTEYNYYVGKTRNMISKIIIFNIRIIKLNDTVYK